MRSILVFLLSCFFLTNCRSQDSNYTYKTLYPNGKIKALTQMKDGKKNGREELFFENGNLFCVQNFKDDLPVDSFYQYDKNINHSLVFKGFCTPRSHLIVRDPENQICSETDFEKESSANGIVKLYFKNGQVATIMEYKNNKKDGVNITYYSNGHIKSIGHNKNGIQVPPTFQFDSTGNVINKTQ